MTRLVLYTVPALAVLVVAVSLLVIAAPRPVVGAKLYGGPSPDGARLSLRLTVAEQDEEETRPVLHRGLRVEVREHGVAVANWEGSLDSEGAAAVTLVSSRPLPAVPVLVVTAPWATEPLAMGTVDPALRKRWNEATRVRGDWIEAKGHVPLRIRVAPARGVLAVPFETGLLVEVRDSDGPVTGAELALAPESLDILAPAAPTNEHGRSVLRVRPTAHVAALEVKVRAPEHREGRWYSTLPVVGGALVASASTSGNLVVQSPIPRDRAYFAVITPRGRFTGGTVPLRPTGPGARGAIPCDLPQGRDAWIVVSSEMDLASPSSVGWPLHDVRRVFLAGKLRQAPQIRTVPDLLLLDGTKPLLAEEAARRARVRRLTALFVATAMAVVILVLMLRVRDSDQRLRDHLARTADGGQIAPSRAQTILSTAVAVLCIMLGFLILALLAMLRA